MNGDQDDTSMKRQIMETSHGIDSKTVTKRVIYYIAGFIITLLVCRIALLLFVPNRNSPFVDLLVGASSIFAWPFFGVFSYRPSYGHSIFEISSIIAIIVYGLVAMGLAKLFMIAGSREDGL